MDLIIDFLVGNYMWFLVITIILIFALIGYLVDSKEHKEVSIFDSPQELAKNLEMLAASAQNKTIGEAVNNQPNNFQVNMAPVNNTIMPNQMAGNQVLPNQPVSNLNVNPGMMNMNPMMNGMPNQMSMNSNPMGQVPNNNASFEVLGK